MRITSATFVKGVVGTDKIFEDGTPQVAFIGRSNVGKSSVINSLVNHKNLARTSSAPGRTREINVFLINRALYLVDLPGYGFAKVSKEMREWLEKGINWYLFKSDYDQKAVVMIIDANIGPTDDDLEILRTLEDQEKNVVIVANKVDKIKKSVYQGQLQKIRSMLGDHQVIPYSAEKRVGVTELVSEILR